MLRGLVVLTGRAEPEEAVDHEHKDGTDEVDYCSNVLPIGCEIDGSPGTNQDGYDDEDDFPGVHGSL